MSGFNQNPFNTQTFGGGPWAQPLPVPGSGPYNYPQITINAPIAPPPQVFTNFASLLQANIAGLAIFRNGLLMTEGDDYTRAGEILTMATPPAATDLIVAAVYALGLQLGGSNPQRYIAPWSVRLTGNFDGVSTMCRLTTGPTILGTTDGINNLFTWGVQVRRVQLYRNGIAQTIGQDFAAGQNALVFINGVRPQPGDILTIFAW